MDGFGDLNSWVLYRVSARWDTTRTSARQSKPPVSTVKQGMSHEITPCVFCFSVGNQEGWIMNRVWQHLKFKAQGMVQFGVLPSFAAYRHVQGIRCIPRSIPKTPIDWLFTFKLCFFHGNFRGMPRFVFTVRISKTPFGNPKVSLPRKAQPYLKPAPYARASAQWVAWLCLRRGTNFFNVILFRGNQQEKPLPFWRDPDFETPQKKWTTQKAFGSSDRL